MTDRTPKISVIMASYNGAAWIDETLASVFAQTFADFEILVVDDCSTDATLEILSRQTDPRLNVIVSDVNQGPVHARNKAFELARGHYVAALDQDDLCHPDRFARQAEMLDANPAIVLVASAANLLEDGIVAPPDRLPQTTPQLIDWLMRISNPLAWSSVMFRRAAALALDPFTRPDRLYAEDFDFYRRLRPMGPIARIDMPLIDYRCHAGGASQRFTDIMIASAAAVLADMNRAILGKDADAIGLLFARHVMARRPANAPELERIGQAIDILRQDFLARTGVDLESRRLIARETSRLWWRMVRASVRSGDAAMSQALAVRPQAAGLSGLNPADLAISGLIGKRRAARANGRA